MRAKRHRWGKTVRPQPDDPIADGQYQVCKDCALKRVRRWTSRTTKSGMTLKKVWGYVLDGAWQRVDRVPPCEPVEVA